MHNNCIDASREGAFLCVHLLVYTAAFWSALELAVLPDESSEALF